MVCSPGALALHGDHIRRNRDRGLHVRRDHAVVPVPVSVWRPVRRVHRRLERRRGHRGVSVVLAHGEGGLRSGRPPTVLRRAHMSRRQPTSARDAASRRTPTAVGATLVPTLPPHAALTALLRSCCFSLAVPLAPYLVIHMPNSTQYILLPI